MHNFDNLEDTLKKYNNSLKPDGCFIGNTYNSNSFMELRLAMNCAENEREGGQSSNVHPFKSISEIGGLISRNNYNLPSIQTHKYRLLFDDLSDIFEFFTAIGENNILTNRRKYKRRDTYIAAMALYKELFNKQRDIDEVELYGDDARTVKIDFTSFDDGENISINKKEYVFLTMEITSFITWKYHESQQKPKERGSADFSLKEFAKEVFDEGLDPTIRYGRISVEEGTEEFELEEVTQKIKEKIKITLGEDKLKEILDKKKDKK
jgi:NADH dehydrogenase [ubiquinone] 1 alpha subcomplex assembly factor 5